MRNRRIVAVMLLVVLLMVTMAVPAMADYSKTKTINGSSVTFWVCGFKGAKFRITNTGSYTVYVFTKAYSRGPLQKGKSVVYTVPSSLTKIPITIQRTSSFGNKTVRVSLLPSTWGMVQ